MPYSEKGQSIDGICKKSSDKVQTVRGNLGYGSLGKTHIWAWAEVRLVGRQAGRQIIFSAKAHRPWNTGQEL